ncbi:MAG: Asp23/Gls24 family envelope stress response protein [Alicyclobacillus sp.]|nr:Asp23/Gls24 family envelope stress response protein [Alicyclobacillus sp.]
MQDTNYQSTELGKIQIADEVIQVIAGLAASEVPGVAGMSGSFAGGLTESLLGRKNLSKGVRVAFSDEDKRCVIDLSLAIEFGVNLPEVCLAVQENVKQAIESMTGLDVLAVHVHVSAVVFGSDRERAKDSSEAMVERKPRL